MNPTPQISLSLATAIDILSNCTAVTVDGSFVTYPSLLGDDVGDDFLAFTIGDDTEILFSETANQTVRVNSDGALVLITGKGGEYAVMPLKASPVNVAETATLSAVSEAAHKVALQVTIAMISCCGGTVRNGTSEAVVQSISPLIQSAINEQVAHVLAELPEVPTDYPHDHEGAKAYAEAISAWRARVCEQAGVQAEG